MDQAYKTVENEPSKSGLDNWYEGVNLREGNYTSSKAVGARKSHKTKRDFGVSFSYGSGAYGSENWGKLFPTCAGQHQSPIDIVLSKCIHSQQSNPLRTTNIEAKPLEIMAINSGKTGKKIL